MEKSVAPPATRPAMSRFERRTARREGEALLSTISVGALSSAVTAGIRVTRDGVLSPRRAATAAPSLARLLARSARHCRKKGSSASPATSGGQVSRPSCSR